MGITTSVKNEEVEAALSDLKMTPVASSLHPVSSFNLIDAKSTAEINYNSQEQPRRYVGATGSFLRALQDCELWLDEKIGIETQGIDCIREEDKVPPSVLNMFLMWWSLTCHAGAIPLGFLGPEFGLTFNQSIVAIVLGAILGSTCAAFCGSLGPKLGLRAIATARYSFGFYGAKVCSIINIVIGVGFATINAVVVGQLLSAVTEFKISSSVGSIVIGLLSYIISLFGFKVIHSYEKYTWIGCFIVLCILAGQIGAKVDISLPSTQTGLSNVGVFLNFLAINFSSSSTWASVTADYFCNYPAKTPKWKIYLFVIWGIVLPTTFTTMIGTILGNIAFNVTSEAGTTPITYAHPILAEAYRDHNLGGILLASYHPPILSKIFLTILALSVIGNNIIINYSLGLSVQLLGDFFHAVPRFIWSLMSAFISTILAVIGKEGLSTIVANFVGILGYWAISFTIILATEDIVFRRYSGYDLDVWDTSSELPRGFAAVSTLFISYLTGGVTGMSQSLYIGPIARKFGSEGGDLGIMLSGVFTLIIYPVTRYYERKFFGK